MRTNKTIHEVPRSRSQLKSLPLPVVKKSFNKLRLSAILSKSGANLARSSELGRAFLILSREDENRSHKQS